MLIELSDTVDTRNFLIIAAVFGAFGGLVAQILTSAERKPAPETWEMYLSPPMGWLANPVVGAAAALIALYILDPVTTTEITKTGETTTTRHFYDLTKLAGMSVIVGASGGTFIAAAKARVNAAVSKAGAETGERVGKQAAANVGISVGAAAAEAAKQTLANIRPEIQNLLDTATNGGPGTLMEDLINKNLLTDSGTLRIAPAQPGIQQDAIEMAFPAPVNQQDLSERVDSLIAQATSDVDQIVNQRIAAEVQAAQKIIESANPNRA